MLRLKVCDDRLLWRWRIHFTLFIASPYVKSKEFRKPVLFTSNFLLLFLVAQKPNLGLGTLTVDVSGSRKWTRTGHLLTSDQPPLPTQHTTNTQQTNIHALSGILNRDPSNHAAADLRHRQNGRRDQHFLTLCWQNQNQLPKCALKSKSDDKNWSIYTCQYYKFYFQGVWNLVSQETHTEDVRQGTQSNVSTLDEWRRRAIKKISQWITKIIFLNVDLFFNKGSKWINMIWNVRGGTDKSLARPTSPCRRTEYTCIVSLERGVCSCAELQVFSCYRGWKEAFQATLAI